MIECHRLFSNILEKPGFSGGPDLGTFRGQKNVEFAQKYS